jgi:hypothetical protein
VPSGDSGAAVTGGKEDREGRGTKAAAAGGGSDLSQGRRTIGWQPLVPRVNYYQFTHSTTSPFGNFSEPLKRSSRSGVTRDVDEKVCAVESEIEVRTAKPGREQGATCSRR